MMSPQMTLISVLLISANLMSSNGHAYYARGAGVRGAEARGTVVGGPYDGFAAHGEARGFRAGGGEIYGRNYNRYFSSSYDRRRLGHDEYDSYRVRGGGVRGGEARGTVVRGTNDGVAAHGEARGFRAGGGSINGRYNHWSDSSDRRRLATVVGGGISGGVARGTVVRGPNGGVAAHGSVRGFRAGGGVYDDSSDRRRLATVAGGGISGGAARGTVVRGPNGGVYAHGKVRGYRAGGAYFDGSDSSDSSDRRRLGASDSSDDGIYAHRFGAGGININGRSNRYYWSDSGDYGSRRRMQYGSYGSYGETAIHQSSVNMDNDTTLNTSMNVNSSSSDSDSSDRRRLGHSYSVRGGGARDGEVRGTVVRGPNDGVAAHGEARGFRAGGGSVYRRHWDDSYDRVYGLRRRLLGHNNGKNGDDDYSDDSGSYHEDRSDSRVDGRIRGGEARGTVVRGPDGGVYAHGEVRGYRGGAYYDSDRNDRNGRNDRSGDSDRDRNGNNNNDHNEGNKNNGGNNNNHGKNH